MNIISERHILHEKVIIFSRTGSYRKAQLKAHKLFFRVDAWGPRRINLWSVILLFQWQIPQTVLSSVDVPGLRACWFPVPPGLSQNPSWENNWHMERGGKIQTHQTLEQRHTVPANFGKNKIIELSVSWVANELWWIERPSIIFCGAE